MKQCKECGKIKPLSNFYKGVTEKDGLKHKCKVCYLKQTAQWREKHPSYMKKYALRNRKITKKVYGISVKTIERLGLKTVLFVYDRANRKCEKCGTEYDLTIHHKDRKGRNNQDMKLPVNNNLENLQVLCRSCHGRIHSIQRWEEYKQKGRGRKRGDE